MSDLNEDMYQDRVRQIANDGYFAMERIRRAKDTLDAVGGIGGIVSCIQVGNDAPLKLVLKEAGII